MKYLVVVDIAPKMIKGTNGCHKYVFGEYKTKREALYFAAQAEKLGFGSASVERK